MLNRVKYNHHVLQFVLRPGIIRMEEDLFPRKKVNFNDNDNYIMGERKTFRLEGNSSNQKEYPSVHHLSFTDFQAHKLVVPSNALCGWPMWIGWD